MQVNADKQKTMSKNKHVLLVTPPLEASGGIGRQMLYLLDAWAKMPHLAPSIRIIDSRGKGHVFWSIFRLMAAIVRLTYYRLTAQVDIVHINISSRGSAARKLALLWWTCLLGVPAILHLHGSEFEFFFSSLPRPLRFVISRSFCMAERTIVLGKTWEDFAYKKLGVPQNKIILLPNAVPKMTSQSPPQLSSTATPRILFLGRLGKRKGVPELLDALSRPEIRRIPWSACLAGDGDLAVFRERAEMLGLGDRIAFPGWVNQDSVVELLGNSEIFVLPSHAEGLAMSVLEAMASNLAVICTPVGAIAEAVSAGESALLVPPGDVDALTYALLRLLEDPELRRRLSDQAYNTWNVHYNIINYAERLAMLYDEVIDTHKDGKRGIQRKRHGVGDIGWG